MASVSIWPVVAAALGNVLLGYFWYHPRAFGRFWMRLNNVTPEMAERSAKYRHAHLLAAFAAGLAIALVMRELGTQLGVSSILEAARYGALAWIGFVVPTSLGAILWNHKPLRIYLVDISFWLVSFVMMSVILVL